MIRGVPEQTRGVDVPWPTSGALAGSDGALAVPGDGGDAGAVARARLLALELLSDVAVRVASSLDLEDTLEHVANAVVDSLGFEVAVLNHATPRGFEVVVAAGPQEVRDTLLGTVQSREVWDALLARSRPLGGLRFVDGREDEGLDGLIDWVPDIPVSDDPDAWHPLDALFAPLRSSSGELIGVLSVDLPRTRRRPGPAQVELLERFAVQAALAIDRARLHDELIASAELFEHSFVHAPVGMALLDGDGRLRRVNTAYCQLLEGSEDQLLGLYAWDVVHDEDLPAVRAALQRVLAGELTSVEGRMRNRAGTRFASGIATRLNTRTETHVLVQLQDVTEQRMAEAVLRRQATTDPLTGLANRARLRERLERLLAAGTDRDVAVLFCDLDHLKAVNDTYGHRVGDELLVGVAGALVSVLREGDVAARIGGDEFVVVLPGLRSADDALALAERLSARVRRPIDAAGVELCPSLSIGIAVGRGVAADELLARADAALYRAKAAGRGCWRMEEGSAG